MTVLKDYFGLELYRLYLKIVSIAMDETHRFKENLTLIKTNL